MTHTSSPITALTLLETATELQRMIPHARNNTFIEIQHNTSYTVRVAQLKVLIPLFVPEIVEVQHIEDQLEAIETGNFILRRDISVYSKLIEDMDAILEKSVPRFPKMQPWSILDIRNNFNYLKDYKLQVDKIISFNAGLLASYYQFHHAILQVENSNRNIAITEINNFLSLCIDPSGRSFSKQYLIDNFNYPQEDIRDVDLENM